MPSQSPLRFASIISTGYEKKFIQEDLREAMAACGTYEHHDWNSDHPPAEEDLLRVLEQTDVLFTGWGTPFLPLRLLQQPVRRLRYICHLTGGMRPNIPREYLESDLLVTNWGDGPMWYLAEGNLALMLACSREMPRLPRHMRDQPRWTYPFQNPAPTLRRKTVGFLGFGAIGRILRDLLAPFEVKPLIFDPYLAEVPDGCERAISLEDLFSRADILTIQAGLTKETEKLVNRALLDRLKPHAIFINTARGKIVNEADLIAFLRDRPDVWAGLDVFEVEPLPKDSPLLQMDHVICYPHSVCAGGEDMYRAASEFAAANIHAYAAGQPLKALITTALYDRMT